MHIFKFQSCLVLLIALLDFTLAHNSRISDRKARIISRQQGGGVLSDGVRTFQTVRTLELSTGTRTETCDVTLTPIKGSSGEEAFREDRICTSKFTPKVLAGKIVSTTRPTSRSAPTSSRTAAASKAVGGSANGVVTVVATVVDIATATVTRGAAVDVPTSSASLSTSGASASIAPAPTGLARPAVITPVAVSSSGSATKGPAVSVIGVTFVQASNAPTSVQVSTSSVPPTSLPASLSPVAAATDDGAAAAAGNTGPTPIVSVDEPTTTVAGNSSGSAVLGGGDTNGTALAVSSASSTAIQLPGTKLQVLPIGLGIFGGITLIALLVVGYVMWERTRYRRMFRARTRQLMLSTQPQMQGNSLGMPGEGVRRDYGGAGRRI